MCTGMDEVISYVRKLEIDEIKLPKMPGYI